MNDKQDFENMAEETIVFTDDAGNEVEFSEIAYFEYEGKNYSVLVLASPVEGIEDDEEEVIFCEVNEDEEGYENFTIVDDEKLNDTLFEEFLKLQEECGCGCGCDEAFLDDEDDEEDDDEDDSLTGCSGCSGCSE